MTFCPLAHLSGAPSGLGRTSSTWSDPLGHTRSLLSLASNPNPLSHPRRRNRQRQHRRRITLAISGGLWQHGWSHLLRLLTVHLVVRVDLEFMASSAYRNPTVPRVCAVRAAIRGTPAFRDVVGLSCVSLVLRWSSSARRSLGLAAAWRCRGQAMPPCRHGGACGAFAPGRSPALLLSLLLLIF
jgi:hypothetical protein